MTERRRLMAPSTTAEGVFSMMVHEVDRSRREGDLPWPETFVGLSSTLPALAASLIPEWGIVHDDILVEDGGARHQLRQRVGAAYVSGNDPVELLHCEGDVAPAVIDDEAVEVPVVRLRYARRHQPVSMVGEIQLGENPVEWPAPLMWVPDEGHLSELLVKVANGRPVWALHVPLPPLDALRIMTTIE